MNFLYVSTLCSKNYLQHLYDISKMKPLYSIQKFHRLVVKGLVQGGHSVDTVTSIPCSRERYGKLFFIKGKESEDGVLYHYAYCINLKIIKNILDFIYSFIYTFFWCVRHRTGTVICDVLNVSVCLSSLIAAKIVGNPISAIVTDMPGFMVSNKKNSYSVATRCMRTYINNFNSYILLTEQMNELINTHKRPYIVMEGLVDGKMTADARKPIRRPRKILYAGGLYQQYGIKLLVDAFAKLSVDYSDIEMHLYGDGPLVDYIVDLSKNNNQIIFHGAVSNDEVVSAELEATLLINPRPTYEAFTKYSFPSKNMEYMVSGTPVLTTKLPGMPSSYYPYVFLFDNENVLGYEQKLREILSLSDLELDAKGIQAQAFVLKMKNNYIQAKRIASLIESSCTKSK